MNTRLSSEFDLDESPEALPPTVAEAAGASSRVDPAHDSAAPTSSGFTGTAAPTVPANSLRAETYTAADWEEANATAEICRQFIDLTENQNFSANQAAQQLGRAASWFSGPKSMLARFRREGVAGCLPQRSKAGAKPKFDVPVWFIPAARFFYLIINRTRDGGSINEAIRRTASLPNVPCGWKTADVARLLNALDMDELPTCPEELKNLVVTREKEGKPMLPERLTRGIKVNRAAVRQYRNPKEASLDFLNSPGGMRLFRDEATGELRLARAGEIIEADDATINFPVCVPWNRDGSDDKCVQKFGVKIARFQWLVSIDVGTSFVTGFSYTARPRSSYRAEDIVSLMRIVVRQHGVPKQWRFERGSWESNLVKDAIKHMGARLNTVYSPHQKPFIEGLFNTLWTKLSVHFPGSHVGRFRGEHKQASDLLTACQQGYKDPRRYFPMLATAIAAFHEVINEKNRTPLQSKYHGSWIPEERFQAELVKRELDHESEWLFCPHVRTWTVRGISVGGDVRLFEDLPVPFIFSAPWLFKYDGAKVKCYFDPSDPRCSAKLVLAEDFDHQKAGTVLGPGSAKLACDHASYIRFVMGWGDDPESAARKSRQEAAAAMRREVRAIMPRGQAGAAVSEERNGLGSTAKVEQNLAQPAAAEETQPARTVEPSPEPEPINREELNRRQEATRKLFEENPLDFV